MKRYQVWKGIIGRWFIMDCEENVGLDLFLNPVGYRAFDSFGELLDFVNNPSSRRCYLRKV